jgi:type II secretory pathway pseudopilin PulG
MRPLFARTKETAMTILEVILAVLVLSMISVAVFQFVRSNLKAISLSSEDINNRLAMERLTEVVQEEFFSFPGRGTSTLVSKAVKVGGRDVDSVEWRSKGGPGLMTTAAKGEYIVRLRIKPVQRDSSKYEIGVEREQVSQETELGLVASTGTSKPDWIPLIPDAYALKLRFFDPRLNTEVAGWTDPGARPSFMRMTITRAADEEPVDAVISIPAAIATQQQ